MSWSRLCCCLLILLCPLARSAEFAPGVAWYYSDFPPNFIVAGQQKGQGFADKREAYISRLLGSDFQQSRVMANVARTLQDMKQRTVCNSAMLKTPEREAFIVFSEPVADLLPTGLIVAAELKAPLAPYLNARGELRLDEALKAGKLRVTVAAERSYGPGIDNALKAGRENGSVSAFYASDIFSSGLLQVVRQRKVDAVPGYPVELIWAQQQFGLSPEATLFLPVEGDTGLLQSRVGCSRNATGKAVVARVNQLLRDAQLAEVAEQAYLEWVPAANHAYYHQLKQSAKAIPAPN